ncbi:MAG: UvrD-helicase domain-containing protein, partial [Acidimicrobiaceae bacterium]|nr:UvrD-helicase domain-containing protein [Acidimicrobiaceae bacterium]
MTAERELVPTEEQGAILEAVCSGGTVAISAAAGSGKTSTLRMIAKARPRTRMLYVAYNKAIQREAERSFPSNVTCKTAHALAYGEFGQPMRARLAGPRMTGAESAKVLGITGSFGISDGHVFTPAQQASMAMGMVARFCHTSSEVPETWHLHKPAGLTDDECKALASRLLPYAQRAWEDLTAGPDGRLKPTHDVYLKQWQLSGPELTGWDVLLYDEAQDADPCVADVIERQAHAQLVAVGDSAQAIYGWRGAGDFLTRVDATHRLALT